MLNKTHKNKIVILTGIGGGIGICAAERLMNKGAKLIGISSKEKKLILFNTNYRNIDEAAKKAQILYK